MKIDSVQSVRVNWPSDCKQPAIIEDCYHLYEAMLKRCTVRNRCWKHRCPQENECKRAWDAIIELWACDRLFYDPQNIFGNPAVEAAVRRFVAVTARSVEEPEDKPEKLKLRAPQPEPVQHVMSRSAGASVVVLERSGDDGHKGRY